MIALASDLAPKPNRIQELTGTVSASRLNCFHTCRLKFYFRYVLELPQRGAIQLLVGKAVHAALQQWSKARWRGESTEQDVIQHAFTDSWEQTQQQEAVHWLEGQEAKEQSKAWGLVETYLRDTPIPVREPVEAVEVQVETDLSQHGLPCLIGIIDLVRSGGRIVDFKTSSTAPQERQVLHRNEIQLTAYGVLYRDATGQRESGLELHHLVKTKQPKLIVSRFDPVTETQRTRIFRSMESYVDGVEREDFVPSPGLHCVSCEFFRECMAWRGGT